MATIIPQALLEEIRLKSDIAAVIGSYMTLQRGGSAFKALCPFHKEKTPSFTVNPQRQIYHCFGCGAGGDVFRFIMDYEKLDFPSAVRLLADKAGVRLAWEEDGGSDRAEREALYALNSGAADLYHRILVKAPDGAAARRYLASRDLPAEAIEAFRIGFAPDRWDTVLRWAGKDHPAERLLAAGLVVPARAAGEAEATSGKAARCYDRFRNRIMFPILDEQGRVVGFSGRVLSGDDPAAKYVNTPETTLFRKGHLLYALHQARRAMVEAREAILCEGQLDVIRCHLAGLLTAVAAQGTAFTPDHARLIKRYADSVVIVFDADRAGQDAALRAADTFVQVGLAVRIAALPEGEDPDSLIRRPGGAEAFRKRLAEAASALDFQIDVLSAREPPKTEAARLRLASAVVAAIARAPTAVQQAVLAQRAAERLGLPADAIQRDLDRLFKRARPAPGPSAPPPGAADRAPQSAARSRQEEALAEHLVVNPELSPLADAYLPLDMIADGVCRGIVEACLRAHRERREVMGVIAEADNEAREFSSLAARARAPAMIKSDYSSPEEAVKLLILRIRTAALQRRLRALAESRQAAREGRGPPLDAGGLAALAREESQIRYDIHLLKQWNTAVPYMESSAAG